MEKIQEIRDQIEQMQLKKVLFGGYSKEDVQMKMDMVFAMFEKAMKKQLEKQAEKEAVMLAEFEQQLQEMREELEGKKRVSDILIIDLNKSISEMTAQNKSMEEENSKMQEANNVLTAENHLLEEEEHRMREANNVLMAEKQQLEEEERRIREENNILLAEKQQILQDQVKMKEAYREYCRQILKEYSESLRSLSGEFSRILENVSSMQKEIDAESIFEGLEKAFEMKKQEVLTGIVVDCDEIEE